jgi:multidrug efflux pump
MHPTDIFVKRPVLSTVLSLVILILGLRGLLGLNIRQYPESSSSVITITTPYIGASAEVVKGFITTPLEQVIASADGIDYIESTSSRGASTIAANLQLNYDPNDAVAQILTKINQVRGQLPEGSEEPQINVTTGSDRAYMYIVFTSDVLSPEQVTDYLTRVVQPQLETVPGVQSAQILGGRIFAMRVWLKPDRMVALGITPTDVRTALGRNNIQAAIGATDNQLLSITLDAATELHSAEQFRQLVVREQNQAIIRLDDIANVSLGAESYDSSVLLNGRPSTAMAINVGPTANPLSVIAEVRSGLPDLQDQLPEGLKGQVVYDATVFIERSITEVVTSLAIAVAIVIGVIFLALGTIRSALIPAVTIPLVMVGTGAIMFAGGFSINLITLLALVLAIGVIVDDAIVVVEIVYRHIQEGAAPMEAARLAGRELLGPVIAMNVVVVAVFTPVALQGGLTGSLFAEFAFTVMGAAVLSGVIGLTLSPMMSGKLLRQGELEGWYAQRVNRFFGWLADRFGTLLRYALDIRWVVLGFGLFTVFGSYWFFTIAKKELAPSEDQGFLITIATADPNVSLARLESFTSRFEQAFDALPSVAGYFVLNGSSPGSGGGSSNVAFSGSILRPWEARDVAQDEVQAQLQQRLAGIGGLETVVFGPPSLPGAGGGLPIQFVVGSTQDIRIVDQVSQRLLQRARESGRFAFIQSDLHFDRKQVKVVIDRDRAAALGIDMGQLAEALATMLSETHVNYFSLQGRSYQVIPRVDDAFRRHPEQLLDFQLRTQGGTLIPASTFVSLEQEIVPRQLNRFEQLNAAILSGVPAPGVTTGEALDFLAVEARAVFPDDFRSDYAGLSRQFVEESGSLLTAFGLAIVLIYLVLAAQFESFRDPLIMLITVPMSTVGAIAFIVIAGASINIYTQIGLITLIGAISKHGILIVEYARQVQLDEGLNRRAAVEKAAKIRLRPILMTTLATGVGLMPLLLASGPGAEARFATSLVPAAGMFFGTIFTLFVLPAFYTVIASERQARQLEGVVKPESQTVS